MGYIFIQFLCLQCKLYFRPLLKSCTLSSATMMLVSFAHSWKVFVIFYFCCRSFCLLIRVCTFLFRFLYSIFIFPAIFRNMIFHLFNLFTLSLHSEYTVLFNCCLFKNKNFTDRHTNMAFPSLRRRSRI
jgi:hypothetical protein